jgi:hypothetical protein
MTRWWTCFGSVSIALRLSLWASPVDAQSRLGRILGQVRDSSTGQPVLHAQLYVSGTPLVGLSDSAGQFAIEGVPLGLHSLRIRALGFHDLEHPVRVAAGVPIRAELRLVPWACATLECEGVRIVPRPPDSTGP